MLSCTEQVQGENVEQIRPQNKAHVNVTLLKNLKVYKS